MAATAPRGRFWNDYMPSRLAEYQFPPGEVVLDVGCGEGAQLLALQSAGYSVVGVEPLRKARRMLSERKLPAAAALAEWLPIRHSSCGAVLCKVVTPYTDERRAIVEIGRVLRPGGVAYLIHHGAGYYLRYLLQPESWRERVYALRTLANTWGYAVTGRRLPGWVGDTLYQSARRLRRAYQAAGLVLEARDPSRAFLGWPVFIADRLRRSA